MPYIKKQGRPGLDPTQRIAFECPSSPGELNFAITMLCGKYLSSHGLNYTNLNEVVGALECAKLEFYRRIAAPYEDAKIQANGDVYL